MNRPIKFRAWDGKFKTMRYLKAVGISADGLANSMLTEDDLLMESGNPERGVWPLMQFTGLTDAYGTEVYEGDIIEFDKWEWYRSPVRTAEDIEKLPPHREAITFDHDGVSRSKYDLQNWCKVIGNIYENPELLNV